MASSNSIALNYVPHLLSLLVLVSLVAPSSSNPTEKLTQEAVRRICLTTGNPKCLQILGHDPFVRALNLRDLTLSYVERSRDIASSTLTMLNYLVVPPGPPLEPRLLPKYRRCWTQYKNAVRDLGRARQRLQYSRNLNGIAALAATALTTASRCDGAFEDRKFPIPAQLGRSNRDLMVFGGIAVGLGEELVRP